MQIHKAWFWTTEDCRVFPLAWGQLSWSDLIWNALNYSRRDSFLSSSQPCLSCFFKLPLQTVKRSRLRSWSEAHIKLTRIWAPAEGGVPSCPICPIAPSVSLSAAAGMSSVQHTTCLHGGMQEHGECGNITSGGNSGFCCISAHLTTANNEWNELNCLQQKPRQLIYLVTQWSRVK